MGAGLPALDGGVLTEVGAGEIGPLVEGGEVFAPAKSH